MLESSQKVDLLRLSLEKRLAELPPDRPTCAAIKETLESGISPSYGTPKKQSGIVSSSSSSSSSSSFFRPASLTGSVSLQSREDTFVSLDEHVSAGFSGPSALHGLDL